MVCFNLHLYRHWSIVRNRHHSADLDMEARLHKDPSLGKVFEELHTLEAFTFPAAGRRSRLRSTMTNIRTSLNMAGQRMERERERERKK